MKVVEQLKEMGEDRFLDIYDSLSQDGFGPLDGEVAKDLRFRPQAVRRLPMAQRARRAKTMLLRTSNAQLAYELFGTYLMSKCKDLVTDFLDATEVPHEDGMIQNLEEARPSPEKVAPAVEQLDGKFDPADVTLYLSMAAEQWPSVPEVESVWRMRT